MSGEMTVKEANDELLDMIFAKDQQSAQNAFNHYVHAARRMDERSIRRLDKQADEGALHEKWAEDSGLRSEVKLMLYEGDLVDAILPPFTVTREDFDRLIYSEMPGIIFSVETPTPGAMTMPFGGLPASVWPAGKKFLATINKRATANLTKNQLELMTYEGDLRSHLIDSMLNELAGVKNARFITHIKRFLGAPNTPTYGSGAYQWQTLNGGISRQSVTAFMKILPRAFNRLQCERVLMNNLTIMDFAALDMIERAADWSGAEFLKTGVSSIDTIFNMEVLTTIQHHLVKEQEWYGFAGPAFMGKHILFKNPAVHVEVKNDHVTCHGDAYDGMTIANTGSFCLAQFTGGGV